VVIFTILMAIHLSSFLTAKGQRPKILMNYPGKSPSLDQTRMFKMKVRWSCNITCPPWQTFLMFDVASVPLQSKTTSGGRQSLKFVNISHPAVYNKEMKTPARTHVGPGIQREKWEPRDLPGKPWIWDRLPRTTTI
jgi:hypothetical protein